MAPMSVCCQVKDLFKELQVECNVVELDLIGKIILSYHSFFYRISSFNPWYFGQVYSNKSTLLGL